MEYKGTNTGQAMRNKRNAYVMNKNDQIRYAKL